jgi:hypothetical protein
MEDLFEDKARCFIVQSDIDTQRRRVSDAELAPEAVLDLSREQKRCEVPGLSRWQCPRSSYQNGLRGLCSGVLALLDTATCPAVRTIDLR